ncbi:WD40 repeat-like protein [Violaceomyces palustris]|uniref:WD40 repeat-like protein n=1 Tax=Violaceomyces palustris TaxID=1673888 RepID=A0ACD0P1X0_9BASI|nr:WD40 repeat-like protein [Violaceomyces palustris]
MSSSGDSRRRAEIEAKRAKLAELKRAREERSQRLQAQVGSRSASESTTPSSRKDLDDLVSTLVGSSSGIRSARPSMLAGDLTPSSPKKSLGPGSSEYEGSDADGMAPIAGVASATAKSGPPSERPLPELIDVETELFEFPQRERLYYTKEVQTSTIPDDDFDADIERAGGVGSESKDAKVEEAIRAKILREQAEEAESRREEEKLEREIEEQVRELTEEEKLAIYGATDFSEFVEQSTKIVERALTDSYDFMKDYRIGGERVEDEGEGRQVRLTRTFWDEELFANRSITDIDWSTKYPELCVVSYNRNDLSSDDPDGLVAIWNMHLLDRPEFVFHAQTDVLSVSFSPFHPNLVIGGTYSGQILIWDTRARALPVLKTPLSAAGHTHPVYSIKMVGTQNAHNLITASTDGTVCSWMLDMLARPQETLELVNPSHAKTDEVSITTLGFPDQETTSFWVGTEEGKVYAASRYDRAGSKAGLNLQEIYRGHSAPITSLHFHPLAGSVDFSDLFLTSSMDWTTKLWRAKTNATPRAGNAPPQNVHPVLNFEESSDYVYDVKWHPSHPAIFGQVDGSGRFDLFNLNIDTERPILSTPVGSTRALNKLSFDRKDGRRVAVGGADGKVYVYDLGDLGVATEEDWLKFQQTIAHSLQASANGPSNGFDVEREARLSTR